MSNLQPKVGKWYHDEEQDINFKVVAIDHSYIEVQHEDGDIEEYDPESWRELYLSRVEAPEDWRNSLGLSYEDMHSDDDVIHPEDLGNSLDAIEPDIEIDISDL